MNPDEARTRRSPALVLLAGGASERLGECKALVELGDATPLERLVRAGACFDASAPIVISGKDHAAIEAALPRGVELAHNAQWTSGKSSSVLCAARARAGLDLCLAPVDVPLVPARVFDALLAAWKKAHAPARGWLAPRIAVDGSVRFGHPIIIGRELFSDLARLGARTPLNRLRELADPLLAVDVDAAEILDDLDTPADLSRLRERLAR